MKFWKKRLYILHIDFLEFVTPKLLLDILLVRTDQKKNLLSLNHVLKYKIYTIFRAIT